MSPNRRTKRMSVAIAAIASFTLTLSACGGTSAGDNAGAAPQASGGTLSLAINAEVKNWNILHATGDVFGYRIALGPTMPHAFVSQPDFSLAPDPALVVEASMISEEPQVVEYKLNPEANWSDGQPISADDFKYMWQVQDPDQCAECQPAVTAGYTSIESVEGTADGKTVTVTFESPYLGWRGLFPHLLPAHIAAEQGDLATSFNEYFVQTVPTWSGGPFQIEEYVSGQSLTLVPNAHWYGDGPNLDSLIVRFITDDRQALTALENDEVQIITPRPTIDLVEQLKGNSNLVSLVGLGLAYEHIDFNVNKPGLEDVALRKAILTAIDRQAIVDKTIGQFMDSVEPVGARFIMPGQKIEGVEGYKDSTTTLGSGDIDSARKILEDAGYTIVDGKLLDPSGAPVRAFNIVATAGNQQRLDTSILIQSQLSPLGITVSPQQTDNLGATVQSGEFDMILFGTNLDLNPVATASAQFSSATGFTGYQDAELDGWLAEATSTLDPEVLVDRIQMVDQRLSEQAISLPLFQIPNLTAFRADVVGVVENGTRFGVTFNSQTWAIQE